MLLVHCVQAEWISPLRLTSHHQSKILKAEQGVYDTAEKMTDSEQGRLKKLFEALKSAFLKASFCQSFWSLKEKTRSVCHHFHVQGGDVIKHVIDSLATNLQGADIRVCLCMKAISDSEIGGNTYFRGTDTALSLP